jgi:serine beta-lactamase-like protein LACTB, mitochondrial
MRVTRSRLLVCILALSSVSCASSAGPAHEQAVAGGTAVMEQLIAADAIPGAAVAVTARDRIVWHDTFGTTDLVTGAPLRIDTRFRVGSVTKMLTVAALLRLVDEGRINLDDPARKFLPGFAHPDITLRQLAGHLSGIRHYTGTEFENHQHFDNATQSLTRFASDPLLSTPGEKYFYSTYGYDVLGAVIERVTGRNFPDAMRDLVTRPLRMNDTFFDGSSATTSLYDLTKEGPSKAAEVDLSDRLPAGAAVTTARDLARFLIAMSADTFLSDDSRNMLLASQTTSDGKPTGVSIGWRIATDAAGRLYLHHAGAVTGGRAVILLYPKERVSVSILTNLGFARFSQKEAQQIAERFLE